jgi:hypothetical protein
LTESPTNGNGNGSLNRMGVWASVVGVGFVLLAALFTLFSTAQTAATLGEENKRRIETVENGHILDASQISSICAHLVEIETQFRAADQVRNLMHANDLRLISLLWQKQYHQPYPGGDPYLPTIAQENPTSCR